MKNNWFLFAYSVLHSLNMVYVKPQVAVRALLWILLPYWCSCFLGSHAGFHSKIIAITNQNTTAMISLGFIWPFRSYGFNNCSCLPLECLMCCYLKIQMPGFSAPLPLRRNLHQVLSSTWAEAVVHFCWLSN